MPTVLKTQAIEKSSYIITATFIDENDQAVVPDTGLNWTLTDASGNIINSRDGVTITPASTITIVLSGDDLAIADTTKRTRLLTVEGTYNSAAAGGSIPIKDSCKFDVVNLVAVT